MKETGTRTALLVVGLFVYGIIGSIELPKDHGLSYRIMNSAGTISIPAAAARQADEPVRRSSCAVIRYYVAKYSAPAAEAWARSQGATDCSTLCQTSADCPSWPSGRIANNAESQKASSVISSVSGKCTTCGCCRKGNQSFKVTAVWRRRG